MPKSSNTLRVNIYYKFAFVYCFVVAFVGLNSSTMSYISSNIHNRTPHFIYLKKKLRKRLSFLWLFFVYFFSAHITSTIQLCSFLRHKCVVLVLLHVKHFGNSLSQAKCSPHRIHNEELHTENFFNSLF